MPTDTFASFGNRVDNFNKALKDPALRKLMTDIGVKAKAEATKAASADLGGDPAFSGWRRGSPINLDTRFDHIREGAISFHPSKRSAGPWTVAEFGRGSAAGPRPTVRMTKSGKVSKAKGKRYNGRTAGKGTATDALTEIDKLVPKMADKHVTESIRRFFD